MKESTYNYFLSWMLLFNSFPPLIGAIVSVLWFQIVQKRISKTVFALCFASGFLMLVLRVAASADIHHYELRAAISILFFINSSVCYTALVWGYLMEKERLKTESHKTAAILAESEPQRIVRNLVELLHPDDAKKLSHKIQTILFS